MRLEHFVTLLFSLHLVTSGGSRLIDGIFTEPTLRQGYNLVATIPRGATALNVTELRNTNNYLAIKLPDGKYLLNGDNAISWSGEYEAVGTTFTYLRQSALHLESIAADGPLQEPIDVMVLYQEPNPGIVYRYLLPGDPVVLPIPNSGLGAATGRTSNIFPPNSPSKRIDAGATGGMAGDQAPQLPRRMRRRRFAWKAIGMTDCNKSCGGGVQTTRFICVREHSQVQVHERRCHSLEKPIGKSLRCNTRPCPAKWRSGPWSDCSVSCGKGVRTRGLECVQEVTPILTMRVADGACIEPRTISLTEDCSMPPCEEHSRSNEQSSVKPHWNTGAWSQCSTSCGPGKRTRLVTCITTGRACLVEEKPVAQDTCDLGPCQSNPITTNAIPVLQNGPQWLFTEWSKQCSAECGTGLQSRRVFCGATQQGESCDVSSRPEMSKVCTSEGTCGGQWFTGPWTLCSSECDSGEQTREVTCVTTLRGALRVVLDMNCPASKPETKKLCRGPPCTSTWFSSEWSQCTRSCGKGMQKRDVRCLAPNGQPPEPGYWDQCKEEDRPAARRICNEHPCKIYDIQGSDNTRRIVPVQNDPEISNGLDEDPSCRDTFSNCALVTQARLCSYQYYKKSCCASCAKARTDGE